MMAVKQPILDQRDQQQLVEQLYQLLLAYCPEWQNRDAIRLDQQAEALVQIFSRMGEMVIRHLNQVPEKNLRTFLDLAGTGLKPPQVAKAPLVFSLAAGAGNYGFVPVGTQVAVAVDSEKPVVFETDSDLTVILPRLVRAVSLNPQKDLWQEQRFTENPPVPAAVFGGKELVPHRLCLGHSQLFDIKGNTIVSIRFNLKEEFNAGETAPWEVKWYCFTDGQPTLLTPYGVNREGKDSNRVVNLLQSGTIYFNNINGIAEHTLTGIEQETGGAKVVSQTSRWIFAELSTPITNLAPERLPQIRSLKAAVNFISTPTGRGLISSQGTEVIGTKTNFTGELKPGDILIAKNQTRIIKSIISDTLLTVNDHFNPDLTKETAFHFAKFGTGTLSCKKGSRQVMGRATIFTEELQQGYSLIIGEKVRKITMIDGDNLLTVDESFTQEIPDGTLFSFMPTPVIYLDKGFNNEFPLDVSKDFYPFGERPRFNDTFYLGSGEVFSKQGAEVTIRVELTADSWVFHDNIKLNWEYWDGRSWVVLAVTSSRDGAKTPQFVDTSRAFTTQGEIRFTCPKIERYKFQGIDDYWMRVRIVKGNYGEDAKYFEQAIAGDDRYLIIIKDGRKFKRIPGETDFIDELLGARERTEWIMNPATLKPPSLKPLTLEYQFKPNYYDLDHIFTYNHFFLKNHGTKVALTDKSFIMPFQPATDSAPGLYLAFDQDIGKLPVSLYLALADSATVSNNRLSFYEIGPKPGERYVQLRKVLNLEPGDRVELRNAQGETEQKLIVKINPAKQLIELDTPFSKDFSQAGSAIYRFDPPALTTWEYWNGRSWTGLNAEDRSQNMTRRDIVSFLVPDEIKPCYLFESYRYWVRARLESGSERNIPDISGVYVNAVWAHHVTTIYNEVLGSGNGMPNQVFKLSSVPVLPGQEILVRETGLTDLERQRVLAEEGADAVTEVRDAAGSLIELWVRWHEVENFMFSKPEDRHYRVDRNQGLIIFGDAVQGMIPPSGAGNIQCRRYQSGGGAEGNVPAGTLTKLRTSYPYIHGVANPEAGDGGANLENLVRALTRGPHAVRHRQRAISAADFEWLVREGSTKINKVKCLSTTSQIGFEPGWVTVIIVPESNEAAPYPSQELIARIEDELFAKVPADLLAASARVRLIGPDYIRVGAQATVSFISLGAAKVIEGRIQDRLTRFFHPLTGGPEGEGWEFGRAVYASEVYQIIEETEGVDYVTDLTLLASVQSYTLKLQSGLRVDQSIPRGAGVSTVNEELQFVLAETLTEKVPTDYLAISGFKEGDTVTLTSGQQNVVLTIRKIEGDLLEVVPVGDKRVIAVFPAGSVIETVDFERYIKSFTLNEVVMEETSCLLKVALLEPGDALKIIPEGGLNRAIPCGTIREVKTDRIYLEDNELVFAGVQRVNSATEPEFPYLLDLRSNEYHDLTRSVPECRIKTIPKPNRFYLKTANLEDLDGQTYQPCRFCWRSTT